MPAPMAITAESAAASDAVTMPLQCGTQWDALSHVFYDGKMYNDRDIALVEMTGAGYGKQTPESVLERLQALFRHWVESGAVRQ